MRWLLEKAIIGLITEAAMTFFGFSIMFGKRDSKPFVPVKDKESQTQKWVN
jgi:hypothetical protein